MTEDLTNYNDQMIEQFRASGGKMGAGPMGMLLLTTTGAKSGRSRLNPLAAYQEDGRLFVIASYAGGPRNPDWYHNLVANPDVTVEKGTETFSARAVTVEGEERDRIFREQAQRFPGFAEYERKAAGRVIPVVELQRSG
jgi:deazaflavin-dependent oxidoreductase (nitroreductase family)